MFKRLLKFAQTVDNDSTSLDVDMFVKGVMDNSASFETYALATLKHQYDTNTQLDFFIHRFNELKVIGFDVSADALLLDTKVDMHQKIDHFVKKYYVKGRMSQSYVKNVFDTLRQFIASNNPTDEQKTYIKNLKEAYKAVIERCQHKEASTFTAEQQVCLLIVGVDAHVLCTPDPAAECANKALNGVQKTKRK